MNPSYQWLTIGASNQGAPKIIDIMGAPIEEQSVFHETIKRIVSQGAKDQQFLCISGELKAKGEGQPASNFRYNRDKDLNERVVDNYFFLFDVWGTRWGGNPIFVTTIPRSWRPFSWFIQEDGVISRKDGDAQNKVDSDMMAFLLQRGVTQGGLIKIRESCKGAKYNTYLIDMISFLYQMKIGSDSFQEFFEAAYRKPEHSKDVEPVGRWTPIEDHSYLYFEKTTSNHGQVFFTPKRESVATIYQELGEIISPYENETKNKMRDYLSTHTIHRWTDFDANDTDDAFTILMMIHALSPMEIKEGAWREMPISDSDSEIKRHLEKIMDPWFAQL
jgi:hypothetical protein